MSDFQDISTSVVVHGAPKVEKFTPMSGQNADSGLQSSMPQMGSRHVERIRLPDGVSHAGK